MYLAIKESTQQIKVQTTKMWKVAVCTAVFLSYNLTL